MTWNTALIGTLCRMSVACPYRMVSKCVAFSWATSHCGLPQPPTVSETLSKMWIHQSSATSLQRCWSLHSCHLRISFWLLLPSNVPQTPDICLAGHLMSCWAAFMSSCVALEKFQMHNTNTNTHTPLDFMTSCSFITHRMGRKLHLPFRKVW
jgi:hypothetical protein